MSKWIKFEPSFLGYGMKKNPYWKWWKFWKYPRLIPDKPQKAEAKYKIKGSVISFSIKYSSIDEE